jgi:hypothetical protein
MNIPEFGAGLRAYQAQQKAYFIKNFFSLKSPANSTKTFMRNKTDIFTYEPDIMNDMIRSHFEAEISKTKKLNTSNLPKEDKILLDENGLPRHGYIDAADSKIAIRKGKNEDIAKVLSDSKITIDDGEIFSFSVDSKSLKVTVSGENTEKSRQIEETLNDNKFGEEIIYAATQASFKQQEICSHLQMTKFYANKGMEYNFGCSLDDITFDKNGIPYLPNGKSVADELAGRADISEMLSSDDIMTLRIGITSIEAVTRPLRDIYDAGGADAIGDFTVNIDYDKNGYIDTMTEHGFGTGQMGWYEKLTSLRTDIPAILAYGSTLFT